MRIPPDLCLETPRLLLRPLQIADRDAFATLAQQDPGLWEYFTLNLADPQQLQQWIELAVRDHANGDRHPFTLIDKQTGQIAGSTSLGNISWHDQRVEIGWSWLGPSFRSSGFNRQAKFALLQYAFDSLGFARVEWKTDERNTAARRGIEKVGGKMEGVLRSHMLLWTGHRRYSVFYSVLKDEWSILKQELFNDLIQ